HSRIRRWIGNHRTLVSSAMVAMLIATIALAISNLLLTAANDRERKSLFTAQTMVEERDEALSKLREIKVQLDLKFEQVDYIRRALEKAPGGPRAYVSFDLCANCHIDGTPAGARERLCRCNEVPLFRTKDKHQDAYNVLLPSNERAKRMGEIL